MNITLIRWALKGRQTRNLGSVNRVSSTISGFQATGRFSNKLTHFEKNFHIRITFLQLRSHFSRYPRHNVRMYFKLILQVLNLLLKLKLGKSECNICLQDSPQISVDSMCCPLRSHLPPTPPPYSFKQEVPHGFFSETVKHMPSPNI